MALLSEMNAVDSSAETAPQVGRPLSMHGCVRSPGQAFWPQLGHRVRIDLHDRAGCNTHRGDTRTARGVD
jgi:hypothetical protein